MNSRTITIKGTGKAIQKPDLIVLSFTIEANDADYQKTMQNASVLLDEMRKSVIAAGFKKDDLKTSNFNVNTRYESVHDVKGIYKSVFKDYLCTHSLSLEFGLDMDKLSRVLTQIASCPANPRFTIAFSIKDAEVIKSKVLENAVENAKIKAEVLAKASGVTLGKIANIDYNFGDSKPFSNTKFERARVMNAASFESSIEITPEDINLTDTVTIVWEVL